MKKTTLEALLRARLADSRAMVGSLDINHDRVLLHFGAIGDLDLGDEVLVGAEHDDEQQHRDERRVHQRQDGNHRIVLDEPQHALQQQEQLFGELHQQHRHGDDEAQEERDQQPAARENGLFECALDGVIG